MTEFTTKEATVRDAPTFEATQPAQVTQSTLWQELAEDLIDFSTHNRALAFQHSGAPALRVLGPSLGALQQALAVHPEVGFGALPEPQEQSLKAAGFWRSSDAAPSWPSAEQWARVQGIASRYELASDAPNGGSEAGDVWQVALFARELQERLDQLWQAAEVQRREHGRHALYLVLGFLKWTPNTDQTAHQLAPLMGLPVQLSRHLGEQGEVAYRLRALSQRPVANHALGCYLSQQFDWDLKGPSEGLSADGYCAQVQQQMQERQLPWRVRRYATLGLLEDLSADAYRQIQGLEGASPSAALRPLLARRYDEDAGQVPAPSEPYAIDQLPDVHEKYPLVIDADRLQHSVVVDSVKGLCSVLDAPEGTGLGRTLANVIAANIVQGKRLLLLSQGQDIQQRILSHLKSVQLSRYCLRLTSAYVSPSQLQSELLSEHDVSPVLSAADELEAAIVRYEDVKNRLNVHAHKQQANIGCTQLSTQEILFRAAHLRRDYADIAGDLSLGQESAESLTPAHRETLLGEAKQLAERYQQALEQTSQAQLHKHPWYAVSLEPAAAAELIEALRGYQQALAQLRSDLSGFTGLWPEEAQDQVTVSALQKLTSALSDLPEVPEQGPWAELPYLLEHPAACRQFIDQYRQIHDTQKRLAKVLEVECVPDAASARRLGGVLTHLGKLKVDHALNTQTLLQLEQRLSQQLPAAQSVATALAKLREVAPFDALLSDDLQGIRQYLQFSMQLLRLPSELWPLRHADIAHPQLEALIEDLARWQAPLCELSASLSEHYTLASVPDSQTLKQHFTTLQNQSAGRWLRSSWRRARAALKKLAAHPHVPYELLLAQMPDLIEWAEQRERMAARHAQTPLMGQQFDFEHTPLAEWQALRQWYVSIQDEQSDANEALQRALLSADHTALDQWQLTQDTGMAMQAQVLWAELEELRQHFPGAQALEDSASEFGESEGPLAILHQQLSQLLRHLTSVVRDREATLEQLYEIFGEQMTLIKQHQAWPKSETAEYWLAERYPLSIAPGDYRQEAFQGFSQVLSLVQQLEDVPILCQTLLAQPSWEVYQRWLGQQEALSAVLGEAKAAERAFLRCGQVSLHAWYGDERTALQDMLGRNQLALNQPESLSSWLHYVCLRDAWRGRGLGDYVDALEQGTLAVTQLEGSLAYHMFHGLAQQILSSTQDVEGHTRSELAALRERFVEYDRALMQQQAQHAGSVLASQASAAMVELKRLPVDTDLATYLQAHDAPLARMSPCYLASLSTANACLAVDIRFDLVIVVQAEQMPWGSVAGLLQRADQVLVCGQRQAPQPIFAAQPSLLSMALRSWPWRQLSVAYRQPASLLDFANRKFYGQSLQALPSLRMRDAESGLRWVYVEGARYSQHRNVKEAKALLGDLCHALREQPDLSAMVLAMNREQLHALERQWRYLCEQDSELWALYQRNQQSPWPLLMGTPEMLTNAHRAHVWMSLTYAPEQLGEGLAQDLLPHGESALQQLYVSSTRATRKLTVFSSIHALDIPVHKHTRAGVRAWRDFLLTCEMGQGAPLLAPVREVNDFQRELIERLGAAGYLAEVPAPASNHQGQVQLLVRDPLAPSRCLVVLMGEAEAPLSARDRERLLPERLQSMGWMLWRLSAANWYRDSEAEIQPLLQVLESLRTPIEQITEVDVLLASDEGDDIDAQALDSEDDGFVVLAHPPLTQNLAQRLRDFHRQVLQVQYPDIDEADRLLQAPMLHALLREQPFCEAEFYQRMPHYLLMRLDARELSHLPEVLEMIAEVA